MNIGILPRIVARVQKEYRYFRTADERAAKTRLQRVYLPLMLSIISFPLRICLAGLLLTLLTLLKPFVLVRFGRLHCYSMGGFNTPQEIYLCERDAGLHPKRSFDVFYHYDYPFFNRALVRRVKPKDAACNQQLDIMIKRTFRIFEFSRHLDDLIRLFPRASLAFTVEPPKSEDTRGLLDLFPLHFTFTSAEEQKGRAGLMEMGIEPGSKFICFHARDGAWLPTSRPRYTSLYGEWNRSVHRNASIENYLLAADQLTELGYYAIRMGKFVEKPLNSTNPKVLDYATDFQSDLMDLFLSAHCDFFIGQNSGIIGLPMVFRRPIAFVNIHPLSEICTCTNRPNIFIPKLLYSVVKGRLLTFREILEFGLSDFNPNHPKGKELQDSLGLELLENTPEEITEVAMEMHQRLNGQFESSKEDDELQSRFLSIIGSYPDKVRLLFERHPCHRIGTRFLARHPELVD